MMILHVTIAVVLAAICSASEDYTHGKRKGDGYGESTHKAGGYGDSKYKGGRYYYGGQYAGKCGSDGLYYKDDYSFVMCSNGNSYVQPCAPGTRNSGYSDYTPGYYYGYSNFCGINLVDFGYSADVHSQSYGSKNYDQGKGYNNEAASYAYPAAQPGYGSKNAFYQPAGHKYEGAAAGYEAGSKYEEAHGYESSQKYDAGYRVPRKYEAPVAYGPAHKNSYASGKAVSGKAYGYQEETSYGHGDDSYQTRNTHGYKN